MKLKFKIDKIQYWKEKYSYSQNEDKVEHLISIVKKRGHLLKDEFITVCKWKSPRTTKHCNKNSREYIKEISQLAFSTKNEKLRIELFTLLEGVDYPTASVFLHFFHNERYPIIDYRALWSLDEDVPKKYDYLFWAKYVKACRKLSEKSKLDMRTIDRALWAFSKEYQPAKNSNK